ncbi:MAG: multifunctional oxoglutarate decarboxylase/oxoglutarate dehydrogenase thiamine pyrophosphate-binding subunit/dihydrolipoyllysine-residue succinyltransferase subunit [Actinomycetota bacterium]
MTTLDRSEFGPNQWLIDEMFHRFQEDPGSVGAAWQEFFQDYRPRSDGRSAEEAAPAAAAGHEPAEPAPATREPPAEEEGVEAVPLRGAAAVIAERMEESLEVPTATSVRTVPAKLLEINRSILNRHLVRKQGSGKVSFTHLIGWAVVQSVRRMPGMNVSFRETPDGKPEALRHAHVNLGLAVDVKRGDGTRTLLVPNIKRADTLDFAGFFAAYEQLVRNVGASKLSPDDFAGTTVSITNPGMIGTVQSVPRLMAGQACIVGVGSIGYPAEYAGADPETLSELGVGKVLTLTSTYDHRVIQGAESGEFLATIHRLLLGEESFYEELFRSMGVPYVPVRWRADHNPPRDSRERVEKQARMLQLVIMYRARGHLIAELDPLAAEPPELHEELDPATYGLTIWDLDRPFEAGEIAGRDDLTLGEVLAVLRDAYCRTVGIEFMHIAEPDQTHWITKRVEGADTTLPPEDQRHILSKLNEAEAFERFLHRKYVGHKRFSLEGAESLIPMLDSMLENAADGGMQETVIGMAHRGRLNVLANIVGKSFGQIFREFEGSIDPDTAQGSGDVKYHVGAAGKHTSRAGNQIVVTVASNPSHLEAVDPVVEGMVRAKQDLLEGGKEAVLPVLIHGDAAFAGQGVVAETLAMSQLNGYDTGGTVHVIVNNQLGFTTGSDYGRSSEYASDVARMVQAPIFHVNGDDPEACVRVARLAFAFREQFHSDVVIDMWCYRRWGHNEGDEPSFTQPLMYDAIEGRRSVRKLYVERLVNAGDLSVEEAEGSLEQFRERLQQAFDETKDAGERKPTVVERKPPAHAAVRPAVRTAVERSVLDEVVDALVTVPEGFTVHPKLQKGLDQRRSALDTDAVDWSLGEALAFGTLLLDGVPVRLSGQDTRRGTFSQRHSVLVDRKTGVEHTPLAALGPFRVYDSLLSEFAAMGFEYGYSVANPDALVAWEAQFGDFANGAQVIVDQFMSAAEDKWSQTSGLVLLLPHGYEGQGPDHSSARLERFLQLSAEDNIQVAVPSSPAQYFHLLRRQALRDLRKPLVVMTPKSLLRLPAARSAATEFTDGSFAEVLADPDHPHPSVVSRVILCSGKVFYDLAKRRADSGVQGVALVRIEQLYPFPEEQVKDVLEHYGEADPYWLQEEPENMGAWYYVRRVVHDRLGVDLHGVTREESASPATGSLRVHQQEQSQLIDRAFEGFSG